MNQVLVVKNLYKHFHASGSVLRGDHSGVRAVDGVSLEIQEGEHLGLVGESGSGKTTLARLIMKLYPVDEGEIWINGVDTAGLSQRDFRPLRKNIQMVFQDPYSSLDPRFTVRRILKEALNLREEKGSGHEQMEYMADALHAVGLSLTALSRFPYEFSGGERQRIAIARALIMKPKWLILDEPVSSLDVLVQAQILELLQKLQAEFGLTYLFITHNLKVVRRLCRRIAVMYRGRIVEIAPTEILFNHPLHPYTQKLLAAAVDYRSVDFPEEKTAACSKNFCLIDKGNGHFVLE